MMRTILCCLAGITLAMGAVAQKSDSLKHASSIQQGSERAETIIRLAGDRETSLEEAAKLIAELRNEVKDLQAPLLEVRVLNMSGHIEFEGGNYEGSLHYYHQALRIAQKKDITEQKIKCLANLSGAFNALDNADSAIYFSQAELLLLREQGDRQAIMQAEHYLGSLYSQYSRLYEAEQHYFTALDLAKSLKDSSEMGNIYSNISVIFNRQGDQKEAIAYMDRAIQLIRKFGDPVDLIAILVNSGISFRSFGNLARAEACYLEGISLIDKVDRVDHRPRYAAYLYMNYSRVLLDKGAWKKAHSAAIIGLENANIISLGAPQGMANAYLAAAMLHLGRLDSALLLGQLALTFVQNPELVSQRKDVTEILADIHTARGEYKEALQYEVRYAALLDSLNRMERDEQLTELQVKFRTKEKEQELLNLRHQTEQRNALVVQLIALAIIALLVAMLIASFFYLRGKKNSELLQKSQEVDRLKSRFFANISHELRTPLTLILTPAEVMMAQASGRDKEQLSLIQRNALRLLKLINQMLDLSKAEAGKLELKTYLGDVVPLLSGITYSFESQAEKKQIQLTFEAGDTPLELYFDGDKLEHILTNLLANALKFTPAAGQVHVRVFKTTFSKKEMACLEVVDTGIGISPEQQARIFDRFFQADNADTRAYEGAGIGLALVKELVDLHHGRIEVRSTPGKGTTFRVLLPLGRAHLMDQEIRQVAPDRLYDVPDITEFTASAPEGQQENLPLVLVVEDHPEVRQYLVSHLTPFYEVKMAENGQEGLDMARALIPDLIISDLMMPVMDGLELTRSLKTDAATDHIPVILLTARADEADKLKGLEYHADEYLTKPFNPKELLFRIQNMILLRRNMQARFKQFLTLQPQEIAVNSMEQVFLEKMKNAIEENIGDEHFDVVQLASAMGLSRSQLFRKMKALTDQSPQLFIRTYRLERAMQLLKQRAATVTEIAYQVGFNSPTYFSKAFSDHFGQVPTAVLKGDG